MLSRKKKINDTRRQPKKRSRKLTAERLDKRELMAGDIDLFSSGFMDVDGTNSRDIIEIKDSGSNQISVAVMDGSRSIRKDSNNVELLRYFTKSDVTKIRVDASGGNDTVRNYTNIESDINGGSGSDSLYGGSGVDDIDGGSGDDYISGGSGNDELKGSTGKDTIYGGSGHDELFGGSNDDYLHGGSGNDELEGGNGNDRMYGSNGHDRLYGDSGNDYLYGGSGNDGLFGGDGIDRLYAGTGKDRVLDDTKSDDYFYNLGSDDARIRFYDSAQSTIQQINDSTNQSVTVAFAGGSWTDANIERIDAALGILHDATGNVSLLKTASGNNLDFYRQGSWQWASDGSNTGSGILGWNSGAGSITMTQGGMTSTLANTMATVIHEIGHNWDQASENATIDDFRALSGWGAIRTFIPRRGGGFQVLIDSSLDPGGNAVDNWGFTGGATNFVREYGKENPREDFATSFAAYFMDGAGRGNPDLAPDKMAYMHDFVDSMK